MYLRRRILLKSVPNDSNDDATLAFAGKEPIQVPGYRILRQLGHGGMGAVYLAEDTTLGRRVAIKVVAEAIARDPAVRARFLREARLLATVEHPNIVRVYSFGASEDRAYLVMEHVEGETLSDQIRRGPMGISEAMEIVSRVADALDAAWEKGIVHRDIKPSNILFDRKGNLKVADFGLAKGSESADTESSLTQTGYLLGSPHYVAPEQAQGHEADFRADIYSLGVTLFEMLTARKPFEGGSALTIVSKHLRDEMPLLTSLRHDAPSGVVRLVAWMTAKNPAQRPSSYRELMAAVQQLDTPAASRQERRDVKWPLIALGSILALAAIALAFAIRSISAPAPPPAAESRLIVAVAPFWGPDKDSEAEGRTMAALIQQAIGTRLGTRAKVIGIDETKIAVRDVDSARALGERLGASAVIWGQAFALHNEREIQPSVTLISRKAASNGERIGVSLTDRTEIRAELPSALDAIHVQSQSGNQIELRKTSAEGIGDLVTFVAAMHALNQNDTQRALDLLTQMRRTPDALYQRAVCFAQMKRDEDAMRELRAAVAADAALAPALALMADIDSRAGRFAEAAAHLRNAAATGRRFTSSEAALYNNILYITERYVFKGVSQAVPTMLAIDPATSHVARRWELPSVPQSYEVADTGMTIRYDIGPPRSGELASIHFANGAFDGPPLPHEALIPRIRRMKAGWNQSTNFLHDLSSVNSFLLAAPRFRFALEDPAQPKTLPELRAALEQAIARDPTQPWYLMFLALTQRELGDGTTAQQTWSRAVSQPFPGTPYYEYAWMARQLEPLGLSAWADQAYERSRQLRKSEPQPVAMTTLIERMLNTPYIRLAARGRALQADPKRQLVWLRRARDVSGICIEGDDIAAFEWGRWLELRHDPNEGIETAFGRSANALFGMRFAAGGGLDVLRYLFAGVLAALVAMLVIVAARRRLSVEQRLAITALVATLIVTAALAIVAAASATHILDLPVLLSDAMGHPAAVASLEDALPAHDNDDFRFLTAVANQMGGNQRRARELYAAIGSDDAKDNARDVDKTPPHMPTVELMASALQKMSVADYFAPLGRAAAVVRGTAARSDNELIAAPTHAALAFYLAVLFGGAIVALLFAVPATPSVLPWRRLALALASAAFIGIAVSNQHAISAKEKVLVPGRYSASLTPVYNVAYPFPPLRDGQESLRHALAHAPAMRLYWFAITIGALLAAGAIGSIARDRFRRVHTLPGPLLDQPPEVKT